MHSSRILTASSSPYGGGLCPGGASPYGGGLCPGGLCPGGLHHMGVVSVQGGLCPGGLHHMGVVSVQGGFCPGRLHHMGGGLFPGGFTIWGGLCPVGSPSSGLYPGEFLSSGRYLYRGLCAGVSVRKNPLNGDPPEGT